MKTNIQMCFGREVAGGGPAPSLLSLEHPKEDVMRDAIFFNFTSLKFQRQL